VELISLVHALTIAEANPLKIKSLRFIKPAQLLSRTLIF
jgi:hypothetical protein